LQGGLGRLRRSAPGLYAVLSAYASKLYGRRLEELNPKQVALLLEEYGRASPYTAELLTRLYLTPDPPLHS